MVLTVDIGNSNIALGGFDGDNAVFTAHIATNTLETEDEYACKLLSVLSLYDIGSVISSVVPQLNVTVKNALRFLLNIEPLVVGPGVKTGISIRCDSPSSVGADLICASVAAHYIYERPALIVDLGTATKMTVVDGSGAFIGTSIMTGIAMGLDALSNGTARLPKVSLDAPDRIVAKNTVDCIKSGAIYGHSSMIDGMICRIKEEVGQDLSVIITGGYAKAVLPYCKQKMILDELLVLKGLNLIYKRNC